MHQNKPFYPDWSELAPEKESYRSVFKWGAPNVFKHPNQRLYGMIKEEFGMQDSDFLARQKEGREPVEIHRAIGISDEQIQRLKALAGPENIATDAYSRVKYGTGKTMEETLMLRNGDVGAVPDVIVHPGGREDVRRIVSYCHEQRIPVYVYGGGSSVNFGLAAAKGGITLVLGTHMNRVLSFNEKNQTVTVEPGIQGPVYETMLNRAPHFFNAKRAYTGGHFPQSFEHSSVGGWIVTLGSGQASSYYGDICDIVLSQKYVTPTGSFKTLDYPSTATGPKVNDMMKGSEGAYGVLVGATLKIFRHMPQHRRRFAFVFPSWKTCVRAARQISQGEFGMPSVFRISDPEETDIAVKLYGLEGTPIDKWMQLRGLKARRRCLMIGSSDGQKGFTRNVKKNVKRISRRHGALYISEYPVKRWEHGRFTDPYMREDLNDHGIIIDTLETAVTWDRFHSVHRKVRSFIKNRPQTICMTHASHFYPQGTNLYFIFIARMNDIDEYRRFQNGIIDRIAENGGSLSHHHGIGKMLSPWMEKHLGKTQMDILRALKRHFDPHGIMNPGGTLGLDG